ncbi:MAG: hypothetical protein ACLFSQ_03490 [Candidatus Zixiibacteriota bacterium]
MRKFIVIIPIITILIVSLNAEKIDFNVCKNITSDGLHPELYKWYLDVVNDVDNAASFNYEKATEFKNKLDRYSAMIAKYGDQSEPAKIDTVDNCIKQFQSYANAIYERTSPEEEVPLPEPNSEETPQPPADEDSNVPDYYEGGETFDEVELNEDNFRTTNYRPYVDDTEVNEIDSAAFHYINSKINQMRTRNDSLREIINEKNERILRQAVNVYDSMQVYQNKISELQRKLEIFTRDSIQNFRMISTFEESLMTYKNRAESLSEENDSLWNIIDDNLKLRTSLNNRIDSLELIITLLDRELMFKENELRNVTPYSSAESYLRLSLRSAARAENEDFNENGSLNFSGIGMRYKKINLFGQNSFRAIEAKSDFNVFETPNKADFYAGGGLWMYPWMLPWLPYVIPASEPVVDSTNLYLGLNYYYKYGIDYLDPKLKDAFSVKLALESYNKYINTELRAYSNLFIIPKGYNVFSVGLQHRILKKPYPEFVEPETFRPSTRFSRHGNKPDVIRSQQEQKDEPKMDSNILMTFEFFASYIENSGLSTPYHDKYESFLLMTPKKSEKVFIGTGLTWGGNDFSFLPNLHNRLAEECRFNFMDIYPIHIDNVQMFGVYTYGNIDREGKLSNFVGDAFYHLPSIPIFEKPMIFRMGFYTESTGRWLTTTMYQINPDTWDLDIRDPENPIHFKDEIVPVRYYEFEAWILLESVPLGITATIPEPADEFPMEFGIETFFNIR